MDVQANASARLTLRADLEACFEDIADRMRDSTPTNREVVVRLAEERTS